MVANIGCYVGVSLFSRQDAVQVRQASLFVDVFHRGAERAPLWRGSADVASLLLSRAVQRQKEIAVRASLGAVFGHLLRQLLTRPHLHRRPKGGGCFSQVPYGLSIIINSNSQTPQPSAQIVFRLRPLLRQLIVSSYC